MGLSYIMDSVLYICLAITFVLILLIVYHFKQRVSALEAKQDTMFELVNNMVQEMQNIRANTMAPSMPTPQMPQDIHDAIFSELSGMPSMIHIGGNQGFMNAHANQDHSVEELETDEDDDDDDTDTETESGMDDDDDEDNSEEEEEEIRQIQVESTTLLDEIPSEHLSTIDVDETIIDDVDQLSDIDYEKDKELSVSKSNELHTEVLEEVITNGNEEFTTDTNYKDLSVAQLKALANERGLATNTSRMKKAEIINILEKADLTETPLESTLIDE
tara:strand:+ start:185 stop:1006 length:822 start_codon:yes stop_codon:yes gene_type:complete